MSCAPARLEDPDASCAADKDWPLGAAIWKSGKSGTLPLSSPRALEGMVGWAPAGAEKWNGGSTGASTEAMTLCASVARSFVAFFGRGAGCGVDVAGARLTKAVSLDTQGWV